jgi:hypothetical protein
MRFAQTFGGRMRKCFIIAFIAGLATTIAAQEGQPPQQPTMPTAFGQEKKSGNAAADTLRDQFEAKIKAEWEAIKNKDKKAYGELLADDYEGVEIDGQGERTKLQAINELVAQNVFNYTLWGFQMIPIGSESAPDAALVIYESTMQFPPKSAVRFSRVYVSELWLKRKGEWKEVHYQETHVK